MPSELTIVNPPPFPRGEDAIMTPLRPPAHPAPEPYRIRSVERIRLLPREQRLRALADSGHNLFRLRARDVFIDLLTDSGTGSMSDRQWAAVMEADESYAGSESWFRFEAAVREVTGFPEVIPTHQGRAAERLLFEALLRPGDVVLSNALFDTTRANVERLGARGIDLPEPAALDPLDESPLKGGIALDALERALAAEPVRAIVLTATANSLGGHPVPLGNATAAARLAKKKGVPLFIDGARFAENAGLLARRDPSCEGMPAARIALSLFDLADGCLVSAKKNGLAHIGGFIGLRDAALAERVRQGLVVTEGFETYGGLAGRDLDAIAVGLREALDEGFLSARLDQVEAFHAALRAANVPVVCPAGGHAVYVDSGALLPHVPPSRFPGHSVACALYAEGGVRSCEVGALMFPEAEKEPHRQLTRLAIPWRTYTASHLDHVARTLGQIAAQRERLGGYTIVSAPAALRHFRAVLAPA